MLPRLRNTNLFPGWVDEFFNRDIWSGFDTRSETNMPSVNIVEENDHYAIEMAAPGLEKKDFEVDLNDNVLTISVNKEEVKEEKKKNYMRREFSYTNFRRAFSMPTTVKEEDIKATYKEGVLKINIPKKDESKTRPPKHIAIN